MAYRRLVVLLGTLACAPNRAGTTATGTGTGTDEVSTGDAAVTGPEPTTGAVSPIDCDEICDDPRTIDNLFISPDTDPSTLHCVRSAKTIILSSFKGPLPPELRSLQDVDTMLVLGNGDLTDLAGLECLRHVGHMELLENPGLTDLTGLSSLESIERLRAAGNPALADLSTLDGTPGLSSLMLTDNPALTVLPRLPPGTSLGTLIVENCAVLQDLSSLADARLMTGARVVLADLPALTSIADLVEIWPAESDNLDVELMRLPQLTALTGLKLSERVDLLVLESLPGVASLAPLTQLREANELRLDQIPVVALSELGALTKVGRLDLGIDREEPRGLDGIHDLTGLGALAEVDSLNIVNNDRLDSLAGLDALVTGPQHLCVMDNPMLAQAAVDQFIIDHGVPDACQSQ